MKKYLLIILLAVVADLANAQTNVFHPYDENNAEWYYESTIYTETVNHYYQHLAWGGDTNILGQDYVKAGSGAIRQDVPNQKMFYMDENQEEFDITINQFMEVGDTLFFTPHMEVATRADMLIFFSIDSFAIVKNIDSIQINGNYRKKYIFHYQNDDIGPKVSLVVGIGMIQAQGFEHTVSLICYSTDNNLHYGDNINPLSTNCTAALAEMDKINFKIYPNPAHDRIQIQYEENNNLSIEKIYITDLDGKQLSRIESQNFSKEIDISSWQKGIYLICIESNGFLTQERFVKLD